MLQMDFRLDFFFASFNVCSSDALKNGNDKRQLHLFMIQMIFCASAELIVREIRSSETIKLKNALNLMSIEHEKRTGYHKTTCTLLTAH